MQELEQEKFTYHLTELRKTLLSIIFCLLILFPLGYYLAPYCMNFLIKWSFPPQLSKLNFFSPMEVFLVNLKIGFIISFIIGFPYIMYNCFFIRCRYKLLNLFLLLFRLYDTGPLLRMNYPCLLQALPDSLVRNTSEGSLPWHCLHP